MQDVSAADDPCPLAHVGDGQCAVFDCHEEAAEQIDPIPLCTRHAALTWSLVDEQIKVAKPGYSPSGDYADRKGYVYFVRIGDLIKIGFAASPDKRMMNYPPEAHLLALFPGTPTDERAEHRAQRQHRAYGREWYRPHPDVLNRIRDLTAEHGDPAPPLRIRPPGPRGQGPRAYRGARFVS